MIFASQNQLIFLKTITAFLEKKAKKTEKETSPHDDKVV